jgi:general transcription factor 3C polypeptide 5 (transcription factor C subunit 1)
MAGSAPVFSVPPTDLVSVEYPSFLSDADLPRALDSMGGLAAFSRALNPPADGSDPAAIELRLTPDDPYEHPVEGGTVSSVNLVLKVTRRRRRRRTSTDAAESSSEGIFTVEPAGVVHRAVRFRGRRRSASCFVIVILTVLPLAISDYQVKPDRSDPAVKIADAMRNFDGLLQVYSRWPS